MKCTMMMMLMMKYEYCMNVITIIKCTLLHKRTVIMAIWRNINKYIIDVKDKYGVTPF